MPEQRQIHRVTAVFRSVSDAAAAYLWLRRHFDESHVSVLLSDKTQHAFHKSVHNTHVASDRDSFPEAEASGAAGVLGGAGLFALAGLSLSGLGLFAVGPIASAMAGGIVGSMVGGLVGGLVGFGFPEESAHAYGNAIQEGATAVGILTHDKQEAALVIEQFRNLHGEHILAH
jgi:hypothetical protein